YSDASYTAKHFATGSEENAFVLDHTLRAVSVTEITFVSESPKENVCSYNVVDAKGALVNRNYALRYEYGSLSITARPITVTTSTFEKVYDGQYLYGNVSPLTGQDEARATNLAGSDRIAAIADTAASMLDVYYPYWIDVDGVHVRPDYSKIGSINNNTQYAVYDGTTDRSDNYTITYVYGKLKITPRPLTITNPTLEKEYNGKPLYGASSAHVQYKGLIEGEWLSATYITEITDVGEVENETQYCIYRWNIEPELDETTHNYTITYTAGAKLKVTPRPIEIETENQSWVYDGTDKKYTKGFYVRYYLPDGSSEYGFVFENHDIVTLKQTTIRNVGSVLNEYEVLIGEEIDEPLQTGLYFSGIDQWGNRHYYRDITKNYSITWVCGTLTVTPRPITLEVDSQTKVYDGTPLPQNPKFVYWSPKDDPDAGLAVDSDHVIDDGVFEGSQTDVGSSELKLVSIKICVIDYNTGEYLEDVTSNYDITYVSGTLTVTPRPITIAAVSQSKVYDGTPIPENPQIKIGYSSPQRFALVSGHAAVDYTFAGTQTHVGESALSVSGARIVERDGSGKEVRDVTFNYEITYAEGKLTVTARPITITTGSDTKIYDGAPFTKTDGFTWQESN
ncbi:MAG: hypothetical protein K2H43_05560, partial [Clostridia bacterium]|nr:hypothetical protein [Clostridia bacterium]